MKKSFHRSLLSLSVAAMGAILLAGGAASAAAVTVPVTGTVTTANGTLTLQGTATVDTKLVLDEFGGAPSVIVSVHVNNVNGRGPASALAGSGEAVLIRPLGASDSVQVSVALDAPGNSPGAATRTATATLALSLDPVTGAALGASGVFTP